MRGLASYALSMTSFLASAMTVTTDDRNRRRRVHSQCAAPGDAGIGFAEQCASESDTLQDFCSRSRPSFLARSHMGAGLSAVIGQRHVGRSAMVQARLRSRRSAMGNSR